MSGPDLTPEQRAHAQAAKAEKAAAYRKAGVPTRSGAGGSCAAQIRACPAQRCPLWPYRPGADPLTELAPDFEASTYARMAANKRREYREVS